MIRSPRVKDHCAPLIMVTAMSGERKNSSAAPPANVTITLYRMSGMAIIGSALSDMSTSSAAQGDQCGSLVVYNGRLHTRARLNYLRPRSWAPGSGGRGTCPTLGLCDADGGAPLSPCPRH